MHIAMRRRSDENGAVVVVVALMVVVIFAIAALAVDLGNAFTRLRDVQSQADFSALAGGADLPALGASPIAADPAIQKAAEYLYLNQPQDDNGPDALTVPEFAFDLTNGNANDGEAYYGHFDGANFVASSTELTIRTPPALVSFGFARILGSDDTDVDAKATVGVFSPGTGPMPVFAVAGCDYGPQTFTDPAGGQVVAVTRPPMSFDTEPPAFNNATMNELTTVPTAVSVNEIGAQVVIDGNQFNAAAAGIVKVGFFRDRTGSTPYFEEILPTTRTNSLIRADVPAAVAAVEDVWWVRVFKGNSAGVGSWSPPENALPLRIGQAVLECDSGASSGNFGTLYLPRTDVSSQDDMIAKNMAAKLEFDLATMPVAGPAPLCTGAGSPAVHAPADGTNCVDTKTGMPANAATQGLITGVDGELGRLRQDTSDRCRQSSYGNRPQRAATGISGYDMNDDILTCFFTDNFTTIEDISKQGIAYSSGVVLDPAIYSSPRFMWVPVLHVEPTFGGSQKYSIKEFRPGFITDQPKTANATNHSVGSTTSNGIYVEQPAGNRVSRVMVVFFNAEALPADSGGAPVTNWMGFGPKILQLTD